jgi:serine/threonine protein kinase
MGKVNEGVVRIITRQLIDGMMHLQQKNVLHRDLKLANIFLHFPSMQNK